jgi:hypothetical protein
VALPDFLRQIGSVTCSAFDAVRHPVCLSYNSVTAAGMITLGVLTTAGILMIANRATRV